MHNFGFRFLIGFSGVLLLGAAAPLNGPCGDTGCGRRNPVMADPSSPGGSGRMIFLPLALRQERSCIIGENIDLETGFEALQTDMARRVNDERTSSGSGLLQISSELERSARRHSQDMAVHNFTGHTGSDGTSLADRVNQTCYPWQILGEIIGWGFGGDVQRMLHWWMESPGHRNTIMSADFEDFGVGYAFQASSRFGHYWTIDFGQRASDRSAYIAREHALAYTCIESWAGEEGGMQVILHSDRPCEPAMNRVRGFPLTLD